MVPDARSAQPRPKLMVTGASGNLGYWICRLAMQTWSVTGIHWQNAFSMDGVRSIQADLTDMSVLDKLLKTIRPRAVIHAAAVSLPARCETHPAVTRRINVETPERLAALCADLHADFIFTSTDLVFDGRNAPYAEADPVTPLCVYGRQKAEAEEAVLGMNEDALVCRLPLMIGFGHAASTGFSLQMLRDIRNGVPLRLLTDEFRSPVSYLDAARGMVSLLGKARGRLHMGGRSRVSRFEMGTAMARQMGIAPTMIQPVTLSALKLAVPRSADCTLNSDKAYALGYDPAPMPAAVQWAVNRFEDISRG